MARKKQTDVLTTEMPAETLAQPSNGTAHESAPAEAAPTSERPRPMVSYQLPSDRTTSIELALWSNTYTTKEGEQYEQLTCTVTRSYKTEEGWHKGGSWRIHDLPCLIFLLQKAHGLALDRRTTDSSLPF